MILSKSHFSESSWLIKKMTGFLSFSVYRKLFCVPTSGPYCPLIRITAWSVTFSAVMAPPIKSSEPGQSIIFSFLLFHSVWNTVGKTEYPKFSSTGIKSDTVFFPSTVPRRLITPASNNILSASVVLPLPLAPMSAMFLISLV